MAEPEFITPDVQKTLEPFVSTASPELLAIPAYAGQPGPFVAQLGDPNAFICTRFFSGYLVATKTAGGPLVFAPQEVVQMQDNSPSSIQSPLSKFYGFDGNSEENIGITPRDTEYIATNLGVNSAPMFAKGDGGDIFERSSLLNAYSTEANETLNYLVLGRIKFGNTCEYNVGTWHELPDLGGNRTGGALGGAGTNNGAGVQGLLMGFAAPMVMQDNQSQLRAKLTWELEVTVSIDDIPGQAPLPEGTYYYQFRAVFCGRVRCKQSYGAGCRPVMPGDLVRLEAEMALMRRQLGR